MKNYYKTLGVSMNAGRDEIKKSFRKLAKQFHPDANGSSDSEGKFKEINEAWAVLGDEKKRRDYDRTLAHETRVEGTRRASGRPTPDSVGDIFGSGDLESFFSGRGMEGIFGTNWDIFTSGVWGTNTKNSPDEFWFPENDIGLLQGLIVAFRAQRRGEKEGAWKVRKSENDKRSWMPNNVYFIRLRGGKVDVLRRVDDWRYESDRSKKIETTLSARRRSAPGSFPVDTFIHEDYLAEYGLLRGVRTPANHRTYMNIIKNLAYIFAYEIKDKDGKYTIESLETLNRWSRYNSKNTRVEGKLSYQDDENREWVRRIPFEEFWSELARAEKRVVQVEGSSSGPERKY